MPCRLVNPTNEGIFIPRNYKLALIEPVKSTKPNRNANNSDTVLTTNAVNLLQNTTQMQEQTIRSAEELLAEKGIILEKENANVNVNVRHNYWAPLNPVPEALHAVELTLFLWHMPEGVAEHSFLGCNHQSTCMSSYSLYVQLLWYPMYYPGGMKARVSPVQ